MNRISIFISNDPAKNETQMALMTLNGALESLWNQLQWRFTSIWLSTPSPTIWLANESGSYQENIVGNSWTYLLWTILASHVSAKQLQGMTLDKFHSMYPLPLDYHLYWKYGQKVLSALILPSSSFLITGI